MDGFYSELNRALKNAEEELWIETILEGGHMGEKYLVKKSGEKPDTKGVRVFRERVARPSRLVICGGGHVSVPIIQIGKMTGFHVTVLEDRPKFADNTRKAGADTVFCEPFSEGLKRIEGNSDTWFVIVTRGHRYDTECLEAILKKKSAYVGMMGSRRRTAIVKEQLADKGTDRQLLESVHTPIGLKIGAQTPEEIAVAVMAEIIQVKNERERSGGYSDKLLTALLSEDIGGKVLATIISRKGSAPRDVGTKMLICGDGSTVDTIGGGCVESEIIQKALLMMRCGTPDFRICTVDMTADAAEDEGMVCGGTVEVMLERVYFPRTRACAPSDRACALSDRACAPSYRAYVPSDREGSAEYREQRKDDLYSDI